MPPNDKNEEMKPVSIYLQFDSAFIFYPADIYFCWSTVPTFQIVKESYQPRGHLCWGLGQHLNTTVEYWSPAFSSWSAQRKTFASPPRDPVALLSVCCFWSSCSLCIPLQSAVNRHDIWSLLWRRLRICVSTTLGLANYVQDDVSNSTWPSQGAKCVAEKGTFKRKSTNNKIGLWLDWWVFNDSTCEYIFLQGRSQRLE